MLFCIYFNKIGCEVFMVGIEAVNLNKNYKKNKIAFAGHNLSSNDFGEKTYKFFIPKVSYKNDAILELKQFTRDHRGNVDLKTAVSLPPVRIPAGQHYVEIPVSSFELGGNEVIAYRFLIDELPLNDHHRFVQIGDDRYNLADIPSGDVLETPKSIYHLLPGTFNPKLKNEKVINALGEEIAVDDRTARLNHFMKFDTNIQDIIEKIPHIKKMGFRRILSTPLFGQDNTSIHGYWTVNPYQITERLGSMEDFKKLQINLFKNSMGFIADGAFTDEGLAGIHLRDIMRNGEKSPFKYWFDLYNFPSEPLKLGILPDTKAGYNNFDIRIVNSPIIWTVDKEGMPTGDFGKSNNGYDSKKPTYIQIYDKRLTSLEQLKSDKVFYNYAIRNIPEKDDISDWMDSVMPYSFPVNVSEIYKKSKLALKNKDVPAKEFLKTWNHFELSTAKEASGLSLWTGNKDIAKLRFTLPSAKQKLIEESASSTIEGIKNKNAALEATEQVQDYIAGVGEFWTNKTAKILREYIANQFAGALTVSDFKNIILAKAGKDLPEAIKYITDVQIQRALEDNYEAAKLLLLPENITDALAEYPLEALEVSDDITSIFAYPSFKEKVSEKLYPAAMKDATIKILEKIDKKNILAGNLLKNGEINEENISIFQLISDDIARFILIKGLSNSFNVDDIISYSPTSLEKLKELSVAKLGLNACEPKEAEEKLFSILKSNIKNISDKDFEKYADYLANRIKDIDKDSIKVANLIIDKSEAGLNWRIDAAKDIAEIDDFVEYDADAIETWQALVDFWKRFNSGVKAYNSHSYKIGEFTDTAVSYTNTSKKIKNGGDLEQKIIENGEFTTQSNYNYMFSTLQRYFSAMPENNGDINVDASSLIKEKFLYGWDGVPGFLYSGDKNNISFSHVATGNHDKQRIAHTFSMNMALAYKDLNSNNDLASEVYDDLLKSALHYSDYYHFISERNLNELFRYISPKNLAKMAALTDAFNKALNKANIDPKSAEDLLHIFTKALDELAAKSHPAEKTFFFKSFEDNYSDIIKLTSQKNETFEAFARKIEHIVHDEFTKPAQIRGIELAKVMVAMPGNPTLYAGDELLELGGEEKAKNVYLQNRNRNQWEKLETKDYGNVQRYKNELAKIFNLRNDRHLTSLVNGDTILLQNQAATPYGRELTAMYRYNNNDDCVILFNNLGFNSSRHFGENVSDRTIYIPQITMSAGDYYKNDQIIDSVGLPPGFKLKPGTKFVDALDSTQKFIVCDDGNIRSINYQNGEYIKVDSAAKILKQLK